MAIIENGYLGGFAGTLGPAIGYYSRGKWCVRSKPGQVRNPRTQAQTEHRELFKQLVCFASTLGDILRVGLRHEAAQRNLSVYNLFVYDNKQAFSMVDGEVQVDYPQLVFSRGPVAPVGFGAPQTDAEAEVMAGIAEGLKKAHEIRKQQGGFPLGEGFLQMDVKGEQADRLKEALLRGILGMKDGEN